MPALLASLASAFPNCLTMPIDPVVRRHEQPHSLSRDSDGARDPIESFARYANAALEEVGQELSRACDAIVDSGLGRQAFGSAPIPSLF
jgi:hypothetical protein